MATLNYLPPWSQSYSYTVKPSQDRTRAANSYSIQKKRSNRQTIIADVTRTLRNSELPYFEWFVREILASGSKKFTDTYYHHDGLTTGLIRIVNGAYTVDSDRRTHVITCQIEIF